MKCEKLRIPIVTGVLALVGSEAFSAQDKYTLKVPNGLAFSEFRGYEAWQLVSISQDGSLIAATLGNPLMIKAYLGGAPGNGKPFPDGAKWRRSIGIRKRWRRSPRRRCQVPSTMWTSW